MENCTGNTVHINYQHISLVLPRDADQEH